VEDPGAKMMSAIGTMIDANSPEEIDAIIDQIIDPAGLFYRFSLPGSILGRKVL
jgi:F420-non-reducing hydrogenase small subunit